MLAVPVNRSIRRSLILALFPSITFILHSQSQVSTGDFYNRMAIAPEAEAAVLQLDPVKCQTFPKV